MFAAFRRGPHEDIVRVHLVRPIPGQSGHSDYDPAACGVVAGHRMWAPIQALPPVESRLPYAHRCLDCFKETPR